MKRLGFLFAVALATVLKMGAQESYGFESILYCNQAQYDQVGFYVNGPSMIFGGIYYQSCCSPQGSIVMTADTNGNLTNSWIVSDPNAIEIFKIRKVDANNALLVGENNGFPYSPVIGLFNTTTGAPGTGYMYNHSSNGFGSGGGEALDGVKCANGDLATTGYMQENITSSGPPGPTNMGICASAVNGYGYFSGNFGSQWYAKGNDIFLIRTGADGDTNNYTKGNFNADGYVKKYGLAYCGGSNYTPAQPTAQGHTDGNFCYQFFSSWIADSTRDDFGECIIEVGGNIFISGMTRDYNAKWSGNLDYEAFVLKLNSAGAVQWCRTYYLGSTATAYEYGMEIAAVTSDFSNDIILTINSYQSGNVELARVSNGNGTILWANSYNFGGGVYSRPQGIKQTTSGNFIVGVLMNPGGVGGYDMSILEIDPNGNVVHADGYGTANMDGTDSWNLLGPEVDQVNVGGTYAISGTTNFSGATTVGAMVVKANKLTNNTPGCIGNQFTPVVTKTVRSFGGGNPLHSRIPVIYETRGGSSQSPLALTSTSILGTTTAVETCTLPIELLSFTATPQGSSVKLNWETSSEINNDYFALEKSRDGSNYEEFARVKGAGNSSVPLSYAATDHSPMDGLSYYRIKQVDYNGKFAFYGPVPVEFLQKGEAKISYNTVMSNCTVNFGADEEDSYNLRIVNTLGQEVLRDEFKITGNGEFEKNYNLRQLTKGIYIAYLVGTTKQYTQKINVQ